MEAEVEDSPSAYLQGLDKTVKILDFGQRKFSVIPSELGSFLELQELYAWENRIVTIPHEISLLKNLRIVVLNSNKISAFPGALCQLLHLTDLHFARNKLSALHKDLANLKNLRVLALEFNLFTSLPEEIYQCESLEELSLNGNGIGEISDSISMLTKLRKLELAEGKLKVLANGISSLTQLNILSVECNNLSGFPAGIEGCTSLKYIRAHYNDFAIFPEPLLSLPNLVHTSIGGAKGLVSDRNAFFKNPSLRSKIGDSILEKSEEPHEILKGLYLGSFVGAKNKHYLLHKNVTDILAILEDDHTAVYPNLFNYHLISLDDLPSSDLYSHFEKAHEIIEKAKGGTLVHCQMGVSRSATIVISYVMKKKKMCLWEAFGYVENIRSVIHPNAGFIKQLKNYEAYIGVKNPYPDISTIEQFQAHKRAAKSSSGNENCNIS